MILQPHYVGFTESHAVTTARVLVNQDGSNWHIQRVATLSDARGHGYAAKIMQEIIADDDEAAEALWNQATESAKFLVDERFWPIYSFIARRSYSEFSIPVLSYRQHINEGK